MQYLLVCLTAPLAYLLFSAIFATFYHLPKYAVKESSVRLMIIYTSTLRIDKDIIRFKETFFILVPVAALVFFNPGAEASLKFQLEINILFSLLLAVNLIAIVFNRRFDRFLADFADFVIAKHKV